MSFNGDLNGSAIKAMESHPTSPAAAIKLTNDEPERPILKDFGDETVVASNSSQRCNDFTGHSIAETKKSIAQGGNDRSNNSNVDSIDSSRKVQAEADSSRGKDFGENDVESEDDDDSDDSSEEEGYGDSDTPHAGDTVSISDSDHETAVLQSSTMQSQTNSKNKNTLSFDNKIDSNSDNVKNSPASETLSDIDDGCVTDSISNSNHADPSPSPRRRSSRTIKQKNYALIQTLNGDDQCDVDHHSKDSPSVYKKKRNEAIVVNDTKTLVEITSKHMKANNGNQIKEPTLVIIDTNTIMSGKGPLSMAHGKTNTPPSVSAEQLYQSIAARGTTVTPVHPRHTSTSVQTAPPPIILPSLTDDMFVVEAPSFIVPYVYEKPSVKDFREFVDVLGRELDRQKEKEAECLVKTDLDKENIYEKKYEMNVAKESEIGSTTSTDPPVLETSKSKKHKKNNHNRRGNEEDDASWDGQSSSDSEDEAISDDDQGTTIVIKEKEDDCLENIKNNINTNLAADSNPSVVKSDNYFDNALGIFFTNIGLNLVQEYVQADLLKQQKRKLRKELRTCDSNTKPIESAIISLSKNLKFSKENNLPYTFKQNKCKFCSFRTESLLVMSHHMETPHMKNNVYSCNFCSFEIKSPHDILYHMEEAHSTRGRLERAPAYHQCANCTFEDNGKGKLARHLIPCAKKFKPELNLAPPVEWEPPAKIPKMTRARNNMMSSYQAAFNRSQVGSGLSARPPINLATMMPSVAGNFRPRGRLQLATNPRGVSSPHIRGNMMRQNTPILPSHFPIMNQQGGSKNPGASKLMQHQPSISITPLPRAPLTTAPPPALQQQTHTKGSFVICEICDGYIKDLMTLRNHMHWIHKVNIHINMIYNRPPLNCQKCQFRFFTDQGLERHLLGSHGLVTSSMQEAANKGKDAGRCPLCGRVYQWKLLNHVARDHNLTLKPAHLSYKCTVCTATFGMYKQFENHVYSAHSIVAKRVMDKSKSPKAAATNSASLLKPLKINDEITIIPQATRSEDATEAMDEKE